MKIPVILISTVLFLRIFGGVFGYGALETENALIFYEPGLENQALEVLKVLNEVRDSIVEDIGNDPGKIVILLKDLGTQTNGFADPVSKQITILTWPESDVWLNFNSWYRSVVTHEFTHIAHLREEDCIPLLFTNFTGFPLLNPQFRTPFVEATTVYEESKEGSGRLNNPFLNTAMLASFSRSWRYSLGILAVPPRERFLGGLAHYIVPASFYSHLIENYGEEKVREFLRIHACNTLGVGLGNTFESVFGESLQREYEKWLDGLKNSYEFPENTEKLLFPEESLVLSIDTEGDWIYFVLFRYDLKSSMGGTRGFVGRFNLRSRQVEKAFDIRSVPRGIKVEGRYLFYMEDTVIGKKMGYNVLTRRIVSFDLESGRTSVIAQGRITSFDVKKGNVYWIEYDPTVEVSTVFENGVDVMKVKGFVREIGVSDDGRLALLISRDGVSSLLEVWKNSKILWRLKDSRYKYSVSWDSGKVTFVMFDDNTADVYSFDGDELVRLTRGLILAEAEVKGSSVYGTTFDPDSPSLGIIKSSAEKMKAVVRKNPNLERSSEISFNRKDADTLFIVDLLQPDFHIPYFLWDGKRYSLGMVLGEMAYDYSLAYVMVPMVLYEDELRLGFGGGVMWDGGDFQAEIYMSAMDGFMGFENSLGLNMNGVIWRESFNPWTSGELDWNLSANDSGDVNLGVSLAFHLGDDGIKMTTGLRFVEGKFHTNYYSIDLHHAFDRLRLDLSGRIDVGEESSFSLNLGTIFPISKLDVGILDPYFHISEIYSGFGLGYDLGPDLKAFLGLEFAQFLTYTRGFLRLGVRYTLNGFEPYLRFGNDM